MKLKTPAFCKAGLPIHPPSRHAAMLSDMSNWPKFHAVLIVCDDLPTLRMYLVIELNGKNRPDFVSRIYRRIQAVRESQELDDMWRIFPGAGCRNGQFVR